MQLLHLRPGPLHKAFRCHGITRHRHAPSHAAGRLHQAGRCQIGGVHHDAGRKRHETRAPVGFAFDDGRNEKTALTQAQHLPGLQVQVVKQGGVDPHFANRRDGRCASCGGCLELASQGIAGLYRLQGDQAAGAALRDQGAGHGRKAHIGIGLQAHGLGFQHKGSRRALITDNNSIAAKQLAGIAPQTRLHAVGQKAHSGQGRHSQSDREHEQLQFTRTQVAPQIAPTQPKTVHPSLLFHIATLPHKPITAI